MRELGVGISGGDAGGFVGAGLEGDGDERWIGRAAGLLRAACDDRARAKKVHRQGPGADTGFTSQADDSPDGAGALGVECGGV